MEKPMLISEMYKFHFGSKIFCSDGEDGTLTQVGFATSQPPCVSYIVVHLGRFFGKNVYLPFDTVTAASGDGITLRITRAELAAASKNDLRGSVLDAKAVVECDGIAARGTLALVAVHPESGELAYLVAHHLRSGQDTLLQQQYVTKLSTGRVTVSIPESMLQTLPPYRSDAELQQEVESILFDLTPLHVDFKGMTIHVLDGVLYVDGNISSSLRGDIVQDQASGVQGLLEIKNRLVGDDQLAADLAMALGRDERTHDLPIGVYPRLGNVRLRGSVHNAGQKAAAEEIASNFSGVRSVTNELIVDPNMDMLTVMSASEGSETVDKVPGKYIRHTK
jgi:osmotically-inducible protein OsmY